MKKVKNKNRKKKKNKKNKLDKEKIATILEFVGLAVAILMIIILYYSGRTLSKYSILLPILGGLLILPGSILTAKKAYEEDEPFASYWISKAFLLIMMIIGFTVAFFIDLVKGL